MKKKEPRLLWCAYNLLFALGFPLLLPRFLYRMWRRGGYREAFGQRFANYDAALATRLRERSRIWVHGVSVGEVAVASQLMNALRALDPASAFILSTTTSTGYRQAARALDTHDLRMYYPLDYPWIVRRALATIAPRALILTESELWPNMIREARRRGIPVILVNARISDRSFPRYLALRFLFAPVLRSFDLLMAQSEQDRARLCAIGADAESLVVTGNFKYDAARRDLEGESEAAAILRSFGGKRDDTLLLMGGSTWPGEEALLLGLYREQRERIPGLRLALAPRHAERAESVSVAIRAAGLEGVRLSHIRAGTANPKNDGSDVLLIDTTGDLMRFYACAQVVFVGKSLCAHGAQNMIEPALCGAAIVVGPHTANFRGVMSDLLAAEAIIQAADAESVKKALRDLLNDADARKTIGERAAGVVAVRLGASDISARQILEILA